MTFLCCYYYYYNIVHKITDQLLEQYITTYWFMSCKRSHILHCWMSIYHIAILDTVHVTCPIQPNNIDYIKEERPITKGYWSHSYIVIMCIAMIQFMLNVKQILHRKVHSYKNLQRVVELISTASHSIHTPALWL